MSFLSLPHTIRSMLCVELKSVGLRFEFVPDAVVVRPTVLVCNIYYFHRNDFERWQKFYLFGFVCRACVAIPFIRQRLLFSSCFFPVIAANLRSLLCVGELCVRSDDDATINQKIKIIL